MAHIQTLPVRQSGSETHVHVHPLYIHSISPFVQEQRESRASFDSVDTISSTIEF